MLLIWKAELERKIEKKGGGERLGIEKYFLYVLAHWSSWLKYL